MPRHDSSHCVEEDGVGLVSVVFLWDGRGESVCWTMSKCHRGHCG